MIEMNDKTIHKCVVCKAEVIDFGLKMCCDGTDCNCHGERLFPHFCSKECFENTGDEMKNKMTWEQYKVEAAKFATYPKENEQVYLLTGYKAEVGEIYGVSAKYYRGDYDFDEYLRLLRKECGDVFWFVAMMENTGHDFIQWEQFREMLSEVWSTIDFYEWDAEEIYSENIAKLTDRMDRGVIQGSGDER